MLESWINLRKNMRLVAEVVRLVAEVVGDRKGLLEIVANIADRSHVRQIATNRTIKKTYDPVWLWLKVSRGPISNVNSKLLMLIAIIIFLPCVE